jgi:hypothetical protein
MPSSKPWHRRALLAALLLVVAALTALLWRGRRPAPTPPWRISTTLPPTWSISALHAHLSAQGLSLQRVSTAGNHQSQRSALFTGSTLSPEEVRGLPCDPRQIDRWRHTVKVWVDSAPLEEHERDSGCWLLAPPFRFFGHPELLGHIKALLER